MSAWVVLIAGLLALGGGEGVRVLSLLPHSLEDCPITDQGELCNKSREAIAGLTSAVDHLNQLGVSIQLVHKTTKCDVAEGTRELFDYWHDSSPEDSRFVLGPICPAVTQQVARALKIFNSTQVVYGVQEPELSDVTQFGHVRRLIPPFTLASHAVARVARDYRWERIALLHQTRDPHNIFSETKNDVKQALPHFNLVSYPFSNVDGALATLEVLKEDNMRIFLGIFDMGAFLPDIICRAREIGLVSSRHQWILTSFNMSQSQLTGSCPEAGESGADDESISSALNGTLVVDSTHHLEAGNDLRSPKLDHFAYRSVIYIAKQLNPDLDVQEEFVFGNGTGIATTDIAEDLQIYQFGKRAVPILLGILETSTNTYVNISEPFWQAGEPPNDSPKVIRKVIHISAVIYVALTSVSFLGMLVSIAFLVFNVKNRNIRFIKMSSPNMNNVIIVGCLLSYTSVFLLGFDSNIARLLHLPPDRYNAICSARIWCLSSAFTLSYGSMFSKTWRVHQIFTNVKMKKKIIKDYQLFVVIIVFLIVDLILLVGWELIDPMFIKRTEGHIVSVSADVDHQLLKDSCHCSHMARWLAAFYAYKGLIMVFGCFLAWETRAVTIPALNDSKYIGINVYVVMLVCIVSIGVSLVMDDVDHSFLVVGVLIIFATTTTLCLVFVPKLIQYNSTDHTQRQRFSVATSAQKASKRAAAAATPSANLKRASGGGSARSRDGDSHTQKMMEALEQQIRDNKALLQKRTEEVERLEQQIVALAEEDFETASYSSRASFEVTPRRISRESRDSSRYLRPPTPAYSLTMNHLEPPDFRFSSGSSSSSIRRSSHRSTTETSADDVL